MADGPLPRGALLNIAGPNWVGNFLHNILCGILIVQVYIYYASAPKDRWWFKAIVCSVFILELVQTIIRSVDRWEIDVMRYGDSAVLDAMQLDWFSTPVLTAVTSAIVQAFFGYRIYVFSKSWVIASVVWGPTLLQLVSGTVMGVMGKPLPLHVMISDPNTWVLSTVITDVLIAVLLSFYLQTMKSGFKDTDQLLTRIIRRTVETGVVTAATAIILMILYVENQPWFITFGDIIGKIYANNLMVMINRRIDFKGNASGSTGVHSTSRVNFSKSARISEAPHLTRPSMSKASDGELWELGSRETRGAFVETEVYIDRASMQ